jgi:hypothetical protein
LPITYASSPNNVCTVNGTTLNLIAIGQCSVTASQAGNAAYLAATDVTQAFNICHSANDCDGDGLAVSSDANDLNSDVDGDGVSDGADNCPAIGNANQTDTDGDTKGDLCDTDDDGDGIADDADNCPLVANSNQANGDGDGVGDLCDTDDDGDGVSDGADNCPAIGNVNQTDTDGDTIGDLCDNDDDNDGILDVGEVRNDCIIKTDCDSDGVSDLTDPFPLAVTQVTLGSGRHITTEPSTALSTCSLVTSEAYLSSYTAPDGMGSIGTQAHFSLAGCNSSSPETIEVEVDFGAPLPSQGLVCKVDGPAKPIDISNGRVSGTSVIYTLTDNGPFDTNSALGNIDDPVTVITLEEESVAGGPAVPVPIRPLWLLLAGLILSLLAFKRLNHSG